MPHKLLEREEILNKTMHHPQDPITTIFYTTEELLKLANITGTSHTQHQAVESSYVIINRTVKFGLAICKWNHIRTVQKTWVGFKQFFLDGASQVMGDIGSYHKRRGNAPCEHDTRCGSRNAGIPAAGAIPG